MKTTTTIEISPDDLRAMIREEFADVINSASPDKLLTRAEAAAILKKSVQTIRRMEVRGVITPVTVAGQPRYRESEVLKKR